MLLLHVFWKLQLQILNVLQQGIFADVIFSSMAIYLKNALILCSFSQESKLWLNHSFGYNIDSEEHDLSILRDEMFGPILTL